MNPELRRAMELVAAARAAGRSDREINSAIRRSGLPVNSIRQLEAEVQARGIEPRAPAPNLSVPEGLSAGERIRGHITNAADKFFAGFGTDVVGIVSPAAKERLDAQIESVRQEDPLLTGATSLAASLPAATGVGRLAGLGRGGLQTFGAGRGLLARGATGAAQVGGAGAAEAGLFAAGATEGSAGERLAAAGIAAPYGAALGAISGGALGTAAGAQQARRAVQESGGLLADAARQGSQLSGRASIVRRGAQDVQAKGRALTRGLEDVPPEAMQRIMGSPLLQREMRRIGTPEARKVSSQIQEVLAGDRGSVEGLTFEMLDDIRQSVKYTADRLRARIPDARGRLPSRSAVGAAEAELAQLDEALSTLPGFVESRRLFAEAGNVRRGLREGQKAFKRPADDFVSGFEGLRGPASQRSYREGALHELAARLNTGDAVETFLRRATKDGSETQQKLQVIMGGEEAFDSFLSVIRREKGVLTKARLIEQIAKGAGFLVGGTSIAGGAGLIATQ